MKLSEKLSAEKLIIIYNKIKIVDLKMFHLFLFQRKSKFQSYFVVALLQPQLFLEN